MGLSRTGKIALALIATLSLGAAQDKKPAWKDQAEYDLVQSYQKETTPAGKLAKLDEWTKKYPESDFSDARTAEYLATFQALNRPRDAFNTAVQMLKKDPNSYPALSALVGTIYALGNPPPAADLDTAEKAASHLLTDGNAIFAPEKKPPGATDAQWAAAKQQLQAFAQRTLGYIYLVRKDDARAETELTKAIKMNPNDGFVAHWLASTILAQKQNQADPNQQLLAIFYYARAANYSGPGELDPATKKADEAFVTKAYATYHGSNDGFDKLVAVAKASAVPPPDFKIASVVDIATAKEKAEEEAAKANPAGALWKTIKDGLTVGDSDAFWNSSVKDSELPGGANGVNFFKVKIISMKPLIRPKELVVGFENKTAGDITVKLDEALPGKMEPGSEIEVKGAAKAYAKEPFMLTLETDKDGIKGWTGKNPAARKAAPKAQ